MRLLLPPGLLLLALVLLLNARSGVYDGLLPPSGPAGTLPADATTVRIFSNGTGLMPENFERCPHAQAIIVDGDLFCTYDTSDHGMRVATFFVGGEEVRFDNYDLGSSDEDVAAFADHVRSAPEDAVLALAVFRSVQPRGEGAEQRARALGELFDELRCHTHPETLKAPSWAYLGIRRPQGWVPLAEALSVTKGVMLAYAIPPDLEALDGVEPQLLFDRRTRIPLASLYPLGQTRLDPLTIARRGYGTAFEVDEVEHNGFEATPAFGPHADPEGAVNRIRFPFVRLGSQASFETRYGMHEYTWRHTQGVELQVLVDGEVAGRRAFGVDPLEPFAWQAWGVDLSPWANRWVELELRTRLLGLEPGQVREYPEPVYWGEPTLFGVQDEPLVVGELAAWDQFLVTLDRNRDRFLRRAEVLERLKYLTSGTPASLKTVKKFPWLFDQLDADGDGAASAAELESFYDRMGEVRPKRD